MYRPPHRLVTEGLKKVQMLIWLFSAKATAAFFAFFLHTTIGFSVLSSAQTY
jgi:hypothetical protein